MLFQISLFVWYERVNIRAEKQRKQFQEQEYADKNTQSLIHTSFRTQSRYSALFAATPLQSDSPSNTLMKNKSSASWQRSPSLSFEPMVTINNAACDGKLFRDLVALIHDSRMVNSAAIYMAPTMANGSARWKENPTDNVIVAHRHERNYSGGRSDTCLYSPVHEYSHCAAGSFMWSVAAEEASQSAEKKMLLPPAKRCVNVCVSDIPYFLGTSHQLIGGWLVHLGTKTLSWSGLQPGFSNKWFRLG